MNDWLNKLKEYWFNKDIDKAVALFNKTTFYQETPFMILKQNHKEFDGIYEIKFNANLEYVYFKSWEMIK